MSRSASHRSPSPIVGLALLLGTFGSLWSLLGCGEGGGQGGGQDGGQSRGQVEGGVDGIELEERVADGWSPARSAHLLEAVGYRDGAQTRARYTLADTSGRRVRVDLLVEVNPRPVLLRGRWMSSGAGVERGGTARADDLHFLGGQGGHPSLGGRFLLFEETHDATAEAAMRLVVPPLPLEPVRPGSLGPVAP